MAANNNDYARRLEVLLAGTDPNATNAGPTASLTKEQYNARRLEVLLAGTDPNATNAGPTASLTKEQYNARRAENEKAKLDHDIAMRDATSLHTRTMDLVNAAETHAVNRHRETVDRANARETHAANLHGQAMDLVNAAETHAVNRHRETVDRANARETHAVNLHGQAMDLVNAAETHAVNRHRENVDHVNARETHAVNLHGQAMDLVNASQTRAVNEHQHAMDLVNATQRKQDYHLKSRVHDETTKLKTQHENNDYDIRLREQQRKDRELEFRLAREQLEDDRELQQSLQHTQIHTRMQHSQVRAARQAARLITNVGCFTCEGTESLVNELLLQRMTSNPSLQMPSNWRDCVSETITSHGQMVVSDLARRYGRLRSATLDDYVMTDNDTVHTMFARAIAAQIRHTAVSSGLSYKSKYALEATQQTMGRVIRFFERVTHGSGTDFAVVHDAVDTGLPARSVAKFRRGGALWASSSPASFWA